MLRRALGVLLFFIGRLGSPPEKDDTCVQRGGEGVRNAIWIKIMPTKGKSKHEASGADSVAWCSRSKVCQDWWGGMSLREMRQGPGDMRV